MKDELYYIMHCKELNPDRFEVNIKLKLFRLTNIKGTFDSDIEKLAS
jgi:hypothetical protein